MKDVGDNDVVATLSGAGKPARICSPQRNLRFGKRPLILRCKVRHQLEDLATDENVDQILSVDEALRRLDGQDPRMGEVVRLRFYAGLSDKETAQALGVTDRTVRRDWVLARAWLQRHMGEE